MFTFMLLSIAAVLVAAGIVMFCQGRRVAGAIAEFDRIALQAPGVVIDMHSEPMFTRRDEPGIPQDVHYPIVEYTLPDGRVLQCQTMNGSKPAPAKVGDSVTVLYDPQNPERIDLAGRRMRHLHGPIYYILAMAFIGMAMLTVAVWVLLKVVLDVPV